MNEWQEKLELKQNKNEASTNKINNNNNTITKKNEEKRENFPGATLNVVV